MSCNLRHQSAVKSINSNKNPIFASSDAPEFDRDADNVIAYEGENVTLTCGARGNPPPVFNWTCKTMNISANTANLTITQATISATYSCTATNHIGKKTKDIYVRVVKRQSNPRMNIPEAPAEIGTHPLH